MDLVVFAPDSCHCKEGSGQVASGQVASGPVPRPEAVHRLLLQRLGLDWGERVRAASAGSGTRSLSPARPQPCNCLATLEGREEKKKSIPSSAKFSWIC